MRMLALTGFAIAAAFSATAASAATTIIDFNDLTAPGFTGDFSVLTTGIGGVAAAPNATPFLVVPSVNSPSGTATYTSPYQITSFAFEWGTPDSYNTVSFYSGTTLVSSVTGAGKSAGVYTYNFASSDYVTSVAFRSSSKAFELDNVSVTAVPEPGTWALMLAGFGMVGFAARRRVASVTA